MKNNKKVKSLINIAVTAGLVLSTFVGASTAQAASLNGSCQHIALPVGTAVGQPNTMKLSGTLCTPTTAPNTTVVDVLVPGGTYDSLYWDFTYQASEYSYVEKTLAAGRATFNFDRIGTGESTKPLAGLVTADTDAYTIHQAIQWLRTTKGYRSVTTIGHSAGSVVAAREAGQYKDVDKVVLTGFAHTVSDGLILRVFAGGLYPAALDSQFFGKLLDPAYLTTTPGARQRAFYSATADPAVIAYDEAHKDIVSGVETPLIAADFVLPPSLSISREITAPVLTVFGDQDIFCGVPLGVNCSSAELVKNHEQPFYANAASFTTKIIPNTGHNLTLHPSKNESFGEINQWINTH